MAQVTGDIDLNPKDIQDGACGGARCLPSADDEKIAAEVADKLEVETVMPVTSMDAMRNGRISDHRHVR